MDTVLIKNLNIDKTNWLPVKFGDVVAEPRDTVKDIVSEGIEHVVGLEHIETGNIHLRNSAGIEESTTFTKKFSKGDVLFGRRRAYLKKAAQASFSGICSGDITVFRAKKGLMPQLLPFVVNNDKFFDYAIKHSAGGLSPRVKFKDLANYEFLLPPLAQQAQLAELLWAMDEVIEKELKVFSKQETLFLSITNDIFTKSSGFEKKLKDVGELIMGQSPLGSTYNETGEGFPFLQGNAEFGNENPINIKYTTAPNKIAPKNSILISVRAPVGDLNIADKDYCIGRGLAAIMIDNESLRKYVYNFFKYSKVELEKNSTGSTFKAINKDILSCLRLIIPNKLELAKNSGKMDQILNSQKLTESKIASSKALQKSLINQIF
jgi:type I restriction enzyme S subunit